METYQARDIKKRRRWGYFKHSFAKQNLFKDGCYLLNYHPYSFSHNHGSVEHGSLQDEFPFNWGQFFTSMIMGGRLIQLFFFFPPKVLARHGQIARSFITGIRLSESMISMMVFL